MKKSTTFRILLYTVFVMILTAFVLLAAGCGKDTKESINVFSWGEYIEPELIPAFEE